ncbi:MAG: ATP-binding protein [Acidimicrobiia bacterium]
MTFLFTDVVGSTALWELAPEIMGSAMARHDALIEDAVATHTGLVVRPRGEGDSRFAVFTRASAAAAAAIAVMDALNREPWSTPSPVQVRLAIHTGEAGVRAGDYYGTAVNRCARLRSLANPGQILVSQATAELVRGAPSEGATLEDLGEHTLRDVRRPERVFQLCHPCLPNEFPPLAPPDLGGGLVVPPPDSSAIFALPAPLARPWGPLIGREVELAALERAFDAALGQEPRIVMVAGEPGIGKTRLLAAAAQRAHERGLSVLYGRCPEEAFGALAPFVEALTPVLPTLTAGGVFTRPIRGRSQLRRLLRDLPSGAGDEAGAVDPEEEQARLLAGLADVLEAVTEHRPTVLILDDLHWADRTTLRALLQLGAGLDRMSVSVIGSYRDNELVTGLLTPALDGLRRQAVLETVPLLGLELSDVGALVGPLAGHFDAAVIGELHARTDGNPLFLSEFARRFAEVEGNEGGPVDILPLLRGIPEGVRSVVRQRVQQLQPDTADMLAVASVVGFEFEFGTLEPIVSLEDDALFDAIDEATAAHLIAEVPGERERFAFTHALVRDTLYESFSSLRRRRLHRRVADQLQGDAEAGAKNIIQIARHLLASDPAADVERVVEHAVRAAEASTESLAFDQATDFYEQALDVLAEGARLDRRRSFEVLLGLATARRATGLHDLAREACLRAVETARELGDSQLFVTAVLEFLWFHPATPFVIRSATKITDDTKQLHDLLDEAAAQLDGCSERLQAAVLAHMSFLTSDDLESKRVLAEDAVARAERSGADAVLALALHAQLSARFDASIPPTELRLSAQRIEELAAAGGDVDRQAFGVVLQVQSALEEGVLEHLEVAIQKYHAVTDLYHFPFYQSFAESLAAMRSLLEGSFEDAEQHSSAALELSGNDDNAVVGWAMVSVMVRRQRGGLAEVLGFVESFAERFANNPGWLAVLALLHAETGDADRARLELADALCGFRAQGDRDSNWLVCAGAIAETAWLLEDKATSADLAEVLKPFSGLGLVAGPAVVFLGAVDRSLGLARLAAGDRDGAREALSRAVSFHRRIGAQPFLALSLFEYALAAESDHEVTSLGEAKEMAQRLGMVPLENRIEALFPTLA